MVSRTSYHKYSRCKKFESARAFFSSPTATISTLVYGILKYALEPSCSLSEASGISDIPPLCLEVTRKAEGLHKQRRRKTKNGQPNVTERATLQKHQSMQDNID